MKINEYIENHKIKWFDITLLSKNDVISFLNIFKNEITIYWFDWFYLQEDWSYQIDQNYCRDYSRFSEEESYNLALEFFLKNEVNNIYYYYLSFSEK